MYVLRETLRKAKEGKDFEMLIFDKSVYGGKGDVLAETRRVRGSEDFVIMGKGWCVGIPGSFFQKHFFLSVKK